MKSMSKSANRDACAAIALACQVHGNKRGMSIAAGLLHISERTARALMDGTTSGATIDTIVALTARASLRLERAAQLRGQLRELEIENAEFLGGIGACVGVDW